MAAEITNLVIDTSVPAASGILRASSFIMEKIKGKRMNILMLGLDGGGKTTITCQLSSKEIDTDVYPTEGSYDQKGKIFKVKLMFTDVGGSEKLRQSWSQQYENKDALIYVIDRTDGKRAQEAMTELRRIIIDPRMKKVVILVFANKMDLVENQTDKSNPVMSREEVEEMLGKGIPELGARTWKVHGSSATKKEGLYSGIHWLLTKCK